MESLDLATLPRYLSDEQEAWALLERLRWPDDAPVCPHCGIRDAKHYFISAKSGERKTKTGNVTYRRLWRCRDRDCRKQFAVLMGTVFESSKVPASKWLLALYLITASRTGPSALELEHSLGVAHQTAWFVGYRLREAMRREPLVTLLSGTVVATETRKDEELSKPGDDRPLLPFNDVLTELLKVDPRGIAGKHRRAEDTRDTGADLDTEGQSES